MKKWIETPEMLIEAVEELGFLPFFRGEIPGFSLEEHTPPELWFTDRDGPWEWKGPAARSGRVVYGKLFRNRAGFLAKEWLPDFANYRRDGYDLDARFDDGLASLKDLRVWQALSEHGSLLSKELKRLCGFGKNGLKGFDTVITRLQMQCYVCTADFEYQRDRLGREYGWGVARYTTPEAQYGADFVRKAYDRSPAESRGRMEEHLFRTLPEAASEEIGLLLG